jgi:predicted transcriptional regulator
MNRMPELDSIIEEIRLVRQKHNIKLSELAKKSSISLSAMSKLENKKLKPSYDLLYNVYNVLYDMVMKKRKVEKVSDIMSKNVETVTTITPISEASKKMKEKSFSQLPVIDHEGRLMGLITERSLLDHPEAIVCGDAIDYNYSVVDPDADKEKVLPIAKGTQAIIVMKDGKIVGILTKADFI